MVRRRTKLSGGQFCLRTDRPPFLGHWPHLVRRPYCGLRHRLARRRPRRSYRRFCVLLVGVFAPLIGQIGLGTHLEPAVAGSIVPSGRVAIHDMITTGYPADHVFYYRGGMQVWRLLGPTVIGGE